MAGQRSRISWTVVAGFLCALRCFWSSASAGNVSPIAGFDRQHCRDKRLWHSLPNPDGVIGFGYNLMTGKHTEIPVFNRSYYDDYNCRIMLHRFRRHLIRYRLPDHVESYQFLQDTHPDYFRPRVRYRLYNSTVQALLDVRQRRSFAAGTGHRPRYDDLYVELETAPIRYYNKSRSYIDAVEELAASRQKGVDSAPVLYTVTSEYITGRFELKPLERMHGRQLTAEFRAAVREAILHEDFISEFFDQVGTHYATNGTFGGVSERWWISRRRPERRCDPDELPAIINVSTMAVCDRFRITEEIDSNDEAGFVDPIEFRAQCRQSDADERVRTSRWMVTSGAPPHILQMAHTHQVAFVGQSDDKRLVQWRSALNDQPSTIGVRLAPICDLIRLVDERGWHTSRCRNQLLEYMQIRDILDAGDSSGGNCSSNETPLKFAHFVKPSALADSSPLTRWRTSTSAKHFFNRYCLSRSSDAAERTCLLLQPDFPVGGVEGQPGSVGWLLMIAVISATIVGRR